LIEGALVCLGSGEFPAADPLLDILAVEPDGISIGIASKLRFLLALAAAPRTTR
jgi:hypothetical protein